MNDGCRCVQVDYRVVMSVEPVGAMLEKFFIFDAELKPMATCCGQLKHDGGPSASGVYGDPVYSRGGGGGSTAGGAGGGRSSGRWNPLEAQEVLTRSKMDPFVEVSETLAGPVWLEKINNGS